MVAARKIILTKGMDLGLTLLQKKAGKAGGRQGGILNRTKTKMLEETKKKTIVTPEAEEMPKEVEKVDLPIVINLSSDLEKFMGFL
jgi:hypothetical protein